MTNKYQINVKYPRPSLHTYPALVFTSYCSYLILSPPCPWSLSSILALFLCWPFSPSCQVFSVQVPYSPFYFFHNLILFDIPSFVFQNTKSVERKLYSSVIQSYHILEMFFSYPWPTTHQYIALSPISLIAVKCFYNSSHLSATHHTPSLPRGSNCTLLTLDVPLHSHPSFFCFFLH